MAKNPFLPLPANLDPAAPDFIATLNDRLRRVAAPVATTAAGKQGPAGPAGSGAGTTGVSINGAAVTY